MSFVDYTSNMHIYVLRFELNDKTPIINGILTLELDNGWTMCFRERHGFTHTHSKKETVVYANTLLNTGCVYNITIDGKPFPETTSNFLDNFK